METFTDELKKTISDLTEEILEKNDELTYKISQLQNNTLPKGYVLVKIWGEIFAVKAEFETMFRNENPVFHSNDSIILESLAEKYPDFYLWLNLQWIILEEFLED